LALKPRPEISNLDLCPHGGIDYAEISDCGLKADEILDFSVCCNPYPPPALIRKSLHSLKIDRYPDSFSGEFCRKLAAGLGISPACLLAGSGTTELIRLIALAYLGPGDRLLLISPTYGEYETAGKLSGAEICKFAWNLEEDRETQVSRLSDAIRNLKPKVTFICQPNNPTGVYLSQNDVGSLLEACAENLLVLDEAYINFVDQPWSTLGLIKNSNVILLRSMTKDYALAGLRLGYAAGAEGTIAVLRRVCPPWNVNVAAQTAGIAALDCGSYLEVSRQRIKQGKQYLVSGLKRLGLAPLPSSANFFLVRVGNSAELRSALLKKGILVRDCASFGLPGYIRIAPRSLNQCRKLLKALRQLQENGEVHCGVELYNHYNRLPAVFEKESRVETD